MSKEYDDLKEKYDELYLDYIERGAEIVQLQNDIAVLRGGQVLPIPCPFGGDHAWDSKCRKCKTQITYNPEATIGSKAKEQSKG